MTQTSRQNEISTKRRTIKWSVMVSWDNKVVNLDNKVVNLVQLGGQPRQESG